MPVCSYMSSVLSVHEVGLHLGHGQVHFLPVDQGNARPEPEEREEKITGEFQSRVYTVYSSLFVRGPSGNFEIG